MGVVEEEGREGIVASTEVVFYSFSGGVGDENWAVFVAFAANDEFFAVEVSSRRFSISS